MFPVVSILRPLLKSTRRDRSVAETTCNLAKLPCLVLQDDQGGQRLTTYACSTTRPNLIPPVICNRCINRNCQFFTQVRAERLLLLGFRDRGLHRLRGRRRRRLPRRCLHQIGKEEEAGQTFPENITENADK